MNGNSSVSLSLWKLIACILLSVLSVGSFAHAQRGSVKGAGYPIVGSQIYLFAVGPSGPISLLHGTGVTLDTAGNGYITTDSSGYFYVTGLYAAYCPTPNSLVYLEGVGGNPGYGGNNPAVVFVTALAPTCSNLPNAPFIFLSEVNTVAAAFTLAPFIASGNFNSSAANAPALANAFALANAWVNGYYGNVLTTGPYAKINTLGDILSECVNTTDTMPCATLFADTTPPGGTAPTDTYHAAIDLALNPTNRATILYNFYTSVTTDRFFTPTLTAAPVTWALVPKITWPTPSAISTATAISSTQLDAIANIPGTFAYSPLAGTLLAAGAQTLSAIFTPYDATSYAISTATTNLTVTTAPGACLVIP